MKTINIKYSRTDLPNRLKYTLGFLNEHPLIKGQYQFVVDTMENADISIHYGIDSVQEWSIPCNHMFFHNESIDSILLFANKYQLNDQTIYSVENQSKAPSPLCQNKTLGFDIFETIFFHISRYEEVHAQSSDNDISGWLKEDFHFLIKNNIEKTPVVDHIVGALIECLTSIKPAQSASQSLSHDIDVLYRFSPWYRIPRSVLAILFHRRGVLHFIKTCSLIFSYLLGHKKDPYDVYDWLFTSKKHFDQKNIYFMSGGETTFDNKYKIDEPLVEKLIKKGLRSRYTMGLHPSYNAGMQRDMFRSELIALSQKTQSQIQHNRQHCLRWSWKCTPDIITHLGFVQDSSMGYNRRIGFRCGTGYRYKMYNFELEKSYDWYELPLVYMESSLIHESIKTGKSLSTISSEFLEKNKYNTHIEMNWHNSNFDPSMWYGDELKNIYLQLIIN